MTDHSQRLGAIHKEILDLLTSHPEGLDIVQIREALDIGATQQHLDKRIRELRGVYQIDGMHAGSRYVYRLIGKRDDPYADDGDIPAQLRAQVLDTAKGTCQMCGKTIAEDHVKLQIDHKIPRNWGGFTELSNLWAICQRCNGGKRDYFATFDDTVMNEVMAYDSVHERLAHTLRIHLGSPTPSDLLEFVANAKSRQDDWHKRLRELRYSVIGLKISVGKKKTERGVETTYTLRNWVDLPPNPTKVIREFERDRKRLKDR